MTSRVVVVVVVVVIAAADATASDASAAASYYWEVSHHPVLSILQLLPAFRISDFLGLLFSPT
jgi:hypothetical protein